MQDTRDVEVQLVYICRREIIYSAQQRNILIDYWGDMDHGLTRE